MYGSMIKIIYKELPINQISYLTREEFSPTGLEKDFYHSLKLSIFPMTNSGVLLPVVFTDMFPLWNILLSIP